MADALRRFSRLVLRLAVALALTAGVGQLAHLQLGRPPSESALRVALRTDRARLEVCRDPSSAEQANLPAHMRATQICESQPVDYLLTVRIDGEEALRRVARHRGVRRNRPLIVDEQLRIAPGRHEAEIDFAPIPPAEAAADLGTLPSYELSEAVDFSSGRVRLASLVDERLVWISEVGAPR